MGFKSIFFNEEAEKPQPKASAPVVQPAKLVPVDQMPTDGTDYNAYLDGEIRKRNTPGPDYLEFSDTLKLLENQVALDEKTRFVVNFTTYQGLGLSAEKLVQSAEGYLSVVDNEKKDFDMAIIDAKSKKIEAKNAEISTERMAIEDLTKQIQAKQARITSLSEEVTRNTLNISGKEAAFMSAYQSRKALIADHITKIKLYLYATVTK